MRWIESLKNKQSLFSIIGLILILLIIWNALIFYDLIKKDEQKRMEIWTSAYESINKAVAANKGKDLGLELEIIRRNNKIPMVISRGLLSKYKI